MDEANHLLRTACLMQVIASSNSNGPVDWPMTFGSGVRGSVNTQYSARMVWEWWLSPSIGWLIWTHSHTRFTLYCITNDDRLPGIPTAWSSFATSYASSWQFWGSSPQLQGVYLTSAQAASLSNMVLISSVFSTWNSWLAAILQCERWANRTVEANCSASHWGTVFDEKSRSCHIRCQFRILMVLPAKWSNPPLCFVIARTIFHGWGS